MPDRSPPPLVDPRECALFLDFDGTLVDFADHPSAIVVPARVRDVLAALSERTGGALAIVTGRDIDDVDQFLEPLKLPVAGVHGLLRRTGEGARRDAAAVKGPQLANVIARLDAFVTRDDGLLLERKPGAVALHFRRAPNLAAACETAMDEALSGVEGFKVVAGKAVIEARVAGHDKGTAIAAFLDEPPFAGRRPVFAGDDVTDEDGFAVVNACGPDAISIKVGAGETEARYRIANHRDFLDWLATVAAGAAPSDRGLASAG